MADAPCVSVPVFVWFDMGWETRIKEGRGEGVGIRTIGSLTTGRVFEVFVWLAAPDSVRDKERLNSCVKCGMSVLSSVTNLLVGTVNLLVEVDMSLSSAMVGIAGDLVHLALRGIETCEGARGSSKKVDGIGG
jgi:hypothetical protein